MSVAVDDNAWRARSRTHKADLKIIGAPVTAATSLSCRDGGAHEQCGAARDL